MLRGSRGDVSGFQTIATCRDGLKNSCDKSAIIINPFASRKRGNRRRPRLDAGKSATKRTNNQGGRHGFVADLSRIRGSRHSGIWASRHTVNMQYYAIALLLVQFTVFHNSVSLPGARAPLPGPWVGGGAPAFTRGMGTSKACKYKGLRLLRLWSVKMFKSYVRSVPLSCVGLHIYAVDQATDSLLCQ